MSHLSEQEKQLYDAYLSAKKAWSIYVENIAIHHFSAKLSELGKKHYKYKYSQNKITKMQSEIDKMQSNVNDKMQSNVNDKMQSNENDKMQTKKLYYKLSSLFHPDKFTKTDKLFMLISNYAKDDDHIVLEQIDSLSDVIYNCPNELIELLIAIFNNKHDIEKFYKYMQIKNADPIYYITNNKSMCDECDFVDSIAYKWYMGTTSEKQFYESLFYNDDELIIHLVKNATNDELLYYIDTCIDKKIQLIAYEILKQKNKDLDTQNYIIQ